MKKGETFYFLFHREGEKREGRKRGERDLTHVVRCVQKIVREKEREMIQSLDARKKRVRLSWLSFLTRIAIVAGCYFATGLGLAMTLPDPGNWYLVPAFVPLGVAILVCLIPSLRSRAKEFVLPTSSEHVA